MAAKYVTSQSYKPQVVCTCGKLFNDVTMMSFYTQSQWALVEVHRIKSWESLVHVSCENSEIENGQCSERKCICTGIVYKTLPYSPYSKRYQ